MYVQYYVYMYVYCTSITFLLFCFVFWQGALIIIYRQTDYFLPSSLYTNTNKQYAYYTQTADSRQQRFRFAGENIGVWPLK